MVINPIIGFYIPNIRIPFKRWDDHPQYKEFRPWHIFIDVLESLTYPPGNNHISDQKRNIINSKFAFNSKQEYPTGSMYGIFTYIWLIFLSNVGKYTSPMDPMGMFVPGRVYNFIKKHQSSNPSNVIIVPIKGGR